MSNCFVNLIVLYEAAIEKHRRPVIDVVLSQLLTDDIRYTSIKKHYERTSTDAYEFHKAFRQTDVCADSYAIWKLMEGSDIFMSVYVKNLNKD